MASILGHDFFFHGPFLFHVAFLSLVDQISLEKGLTDAQLDFVFIVGVQAFL